MRSHDDRIQMCERQFREVCVDSLNDSTHTQQDLADLAGVHQCTIARWFAYTGEVPIPAYVLSVLPREVALPILAHVARKHDHDVVPCAPHAKELNGNLEDEELDLAAELGKLVEAARTTDRRKVLRHLEKMSVLISRARSEIYNMG